MTKFKFRIFDFPDTNIGEIDRLLPNYFSLIDEEGDIFLFVNIDERINEKQVQFLVDREFDRIFFLTGCKINFSLVNIEYPDGHKKSLCDIKFSINAIQAIPDNIGPQLWENNIDTQLKLWFLAHGENIPLASKINLLFQILEIEYPYTGNQTIYPLYEDSSSEPSPMTEAKLLRHIVSHGKSPINNHQLRKYCEFLGLRPEMHDPANAEFIDIINRRLPVITRLAKEIIEAKLTKIHI